MSACLFSFFCWSVSGRFGSGRKQEGGLGWVQNRREVVPLYLCPLITDMSSDVMWYSGQSYLVIYRATRGLGLVKRLRCSSVFKQKYSFKGGRDKWKIWPVFSSNNGWTSSCWFQENLLSAWSLLTRSLAFPSQKLLPCSLALFTVFIARLATPMTTFYPQAETKAQSFIFFNSWRS